MFCVYYRALDDRDISRVYNIEVIVYELKCRK